MKCQILFSGKYRKNTVEIICMKCQILFSWENAKQSNQGNLPNGYVMTAAGVQEMELNAQTKLCSVKHEK